MKLFDIIKNVGSAVVRNVVPGGGLIVDAVNSFLPEDKKLPSTATGSDINNAIESLPPETRAQVMEKEFDVDITQIKESYSTVRAMLESDAQNPQTTRPYIAKQSFHVVAFILIVTILIWAYGIGSGKKDMVEVVMDGWPFVLAVIGPLVVLLHAYFGVLRTEHKNKMDAANGSTTPSGIAGLLTTILKK